MNQQPGGDGISSERALEILTEGTLEPLGLLPNSSNYTFLARVRHHLGQTLAVYKPRAGETPLWDFPEGTLCLREVAAYEVATMLGFAFVPPTVLRDGPHGVGSVQLFIDADLELHYLNAPPDMDDGFRRVCAFDLLINNADRKSGHCLRELETGRLWVVDHGVSFHEQSKLRTVIWDFAGQPIPADALKAIQGLAEGDDARLGSYLSEPEIAALRRRAQMIVEMGVFPEPGPGRPFPWPPV